MHCFEVSNGSLACGAWHKGRVSRNRRSRRRRRCGRSRHQKIEIPASQRHKIMVSKAEANTYRDRHNAIIVTTTSVMEIRAVQSGIDDTYVSVPEMVLIAMERPSTSDHGPCPWGGTKS